MVKGVSVHFLLKKSLLLSILFVSDLVVVLALYISKCLEGFVF